MKKFEVKITEKLVKSVLVEAEDSIEAEQIINDAYRRADIVLDSEDFYGETLFSATEVEDEKYNELKELGFNVITESEEE